MNRKPQRKKRPTRPEPNFQEIVFAFACFTADMLGIPRPKVTPRNLPKKTGGKTLEQARAEAAEFITKHAGCPDMAKSITADGGARRIVYRTAAAALHPDNRETGNSELFVKLQDAMRILNLPNDTVR